MRLSDEDYQEIIDRVNAGLIVMRTHPVLEYQIFNYTARTQYDNMWDEYTKTCRGLILDSNHNIIAKPFPKFFNLNETPETTLINLPAEIPVITEKLDGMLGLLFPETNKPAIATRGSFDSEYTLWATNWLRQKGYSMDDFKPDYTYCFEIVYPGSRIVVDYKGRSELVLLAALNKENKTELDHVKEAMELNLPFAKELYFDEIGLALEYLNKIDGINQEGVVCRYSTGLRLKLKSEDYRRLHKIIAGFSTKDVWDALRQNKSLDSMLDVVPDEFYQWIKKTEVELRQSFNEIMDAANLMVVEAENLPTPTRKEQALYIISHTKDRKGLSNVVFFLLDNNFEKAESAAWKMIEPAPDTSRATLS